MRFELEWVKELHPCGPEGNENARMIGHVRILGTDFHVNAEQVVEDDGEQSTIVEEHDTYAPEIWQITQGAGATVTIEGREYLLMITPFQR